MRYPVLLVAIFVLVLGCSKSGGNGQASADVPTTDVTRTMVGRWGIDGEASLNVTLNGDRHPTGDFGVFVRM